MQSHAETFARSAVVERMCLARVPRCRAMTLASASGSTSSNQEVVNLLVPAIQSSTSVEGGNVGWRVSWHSLLGNRTCISAQWGRIGWCSRQHICVVFSVSRNAHDMCVVLALVAVRKLCPAVIRSVEPHWCADHPCKSRVMPRLLDLSAHVLTHAEEWDGENPRWLQVAPSSLPNAGTDPEPRLLDVKICLLLESIMVLFRPF